MKRGFSGEAWAGFVLAAVVFSVYVLTLTPGVSPTDGGELTLAAWLPGIAHAPGFPLYVVLGWLWIHLLPVGRVVWRLNLLSALCGATAVGLTYALTLRMLRGRTDWRFALQLAAAVAALVLGLGRTAWNWATLAEVYALNLALTAGVLLLVVKTSPLAPPPSTGSEQALRGKGSSRKSRKTRQQSSILPEGHQSPPVLKMALRLRIRGFSRFLPPTTRPAKASSPAAHFSSAIPKGGCALAPAAAWASVLKMAPSAGCGRSPCAWDRPTEPPRSMPGRARSETGPSELFSLLVAAFLFGLGLGNHLTSIALLAPAIAYWLTARHGWRFWLSKTALYAGLALIAGAAIYLYLPLRAAADPLLNWGDPDTWQRFWWHVTAKQYRVSLFSAPVWPQVILAAQLWWTQFTPLGLALLALGIWQTAKRQRPLFWALLLIVVFTTFYAWAYVIEDDGDAYYLPAFLAGAVWVAWGAEIVLSWLMKHVGTSGGRAALVATLLVPALALAMNWSACNRRGDTIPEDYVRDAFAEIGPNGLLLTRDWQLYSPALYLQRVEGLRPDLTVIDTELLRRGWYFGYLHAADPVLMRSVAGEEDRFLVLRDAWERGDIPDGDPRIGQLQAAYVALIDAFVKQADATGRPVHIGPNRGAGPFRAVTLRGQPDMEPGVGTGWRWVPIGLSFRATPPSTLPQAGGKLPALAWRIEPFRQVVLTAPELKIQATRADMAALRGLYQAQTGNTAAAEADWRIALAVEPDHEAAKEWLARLKPSR